MIEPLPPVQKPMLAAIAGEPVATTPFWLMRQAGRYLPEYRELRARTGGFLDLCLDSDRAVEATLQPIRRFGMDAAILFSDILVVPWALGQDLAFQEGEGPKLDPIRSESDLRRLALEPDFERLSPVYRALGQLRRQLPPPVALIGFAGAPWTLSTYMIEGGSSRSFSHALAWQETAPESFSRLIALLTRAVAAHLMRQIEAGAEIVQIFDSWAGVLDDAAYDRWVVAPISEIVQQLRAVRPDVPIIGFPRASGTRYRRFAEGTGVDMVSVDQAMTPEDARAALGDITAIQGMLDPQILVAGGPALEAAIRHQLAVLAGTRHVFNLGHGVVPETPPEHVQALSALVKSIPYA